MEKKKGSEDLTKRLKLLEYQISEIKDHLYKVEGLVETILSNLKAKPDYNYDRSVDIIKIPSEELDYTQRRVYEFLISRGDIGATAREISDALGISRSHASAILNEFSKNGMADKIRVQREVKFIATKNRREKNY